jgi:hypothetical protein
MSEEVKFRNQVDQPNEEVKLKMLEFFLNTSVPRIVKAEREINENLITIKEDER